MIPKPSRETDKDYLEYIKKQSCLCQDSDCFGDTVPHHTRSKGAGGADWLTIPLCGYHHGILHSPNMGNRRFQEFHNIDFRDEIIKLLIGYIKKHTLPL